MPWNASLLQARAESCCCIFAMSRKLNATSLERNSGHLLLWWRELGASADDELHDQGSPSAAPLFIFEFRRTWCLLKDELFLVVKQPWEHGGSSICDKCECGEVQDEKHVLFFCKCAEVCELRMRYRDLYERMFKTLRVFAPSSSEFIPFLTCHHSITVFEINAFLNQDSYRLLKFVSDLGSIFDTGWFCFTSQLPSARVSGCRPSL